MGAKFISRDDVVVPEETVMGGKPSKATPADQRLAANKAKPAANTIGQRPPGRGPVLKPKKS